MERPIEELNQAFDAFLKKESGEAPNETQITPEAPPILRKTSDASLGNDIVEVRHFERGAEKSKIREKNFGKIDPRKYGSAFDASLQRVSKLHDKQITKSADEKIYYNEVLWGAVKESQLPSKNENVSEGFMLITLANRIKRKYEKDFKELGDHFDLDISICSAVGSDLEKDKGVVAIIECRTADSLIKNKFYVTTKGYKRDIRHDVPEPSYLNKNFQNLGTPSISLPIPFDGFEEDDLMTVKINNLPNKICDDAAGKMLSTLKRNEVYA